MSMAYSMPEGSTTALPSPVCSSTYTALGTSGIGRSSDAVTPHDAKSEDQPTSCDFAQPIEWPTRPQSSVRTSARDRWVPIQGLTVTGAAVICAATPKSSENIDHLSW